jgi:hypothetical protein
MFFESAAVTYDVAVFVDAWQTTRIAAPVLGTEL